MTSSEIEIHNDPHIPDEEPLQGNAKTQVADELLPKVTESFQRTFPETKDRIIQEWPDKALHSMLQTFAANQAAMMEHTDYVPKVAPSPFGTNIFIEVSGDSIIAIVVSDVRHYLSGKDIAASNTEATTAIRTLADRLITVVHGSAMNLLSPDLVASMGE